MRISVELFRDTALCFTDNHGWLAFIWDSQILLRFLNTLSGRLQGLCTIFRLRRVMLMKSKLQSPAAKWFRFNGSMYNLETTILSHSFQRTLWKLRIINYLRAHLVSWPLQLCLVPINQKFASLIGAARHKQSTALTFLAFIWDDLRLHFKDLGVQSRIGWDSTAPDARNSTRTSLTFRLVRMVKQTQTFLC